MIRWFFSDRYSRFELVGFTILLVATDLPVWGDFAALFALVVANSAAQAIFMKGAKP